MRPKSNIRQRWLPLELLKKQAKNLLASGFGSWLRIEVSVLRVCQPVRQFEIIDLNASEGSVAGNQRAILNYYRGLVSPSMILDAFLETLGARD